MRPSYMHNVFLYQSDGCLNIKTVFPCIVIKVTWSRDQLTFVMGIFILVRQHSILKRPHPPQDCISTTLNVGQHLYWNGLKMNIQWRHNERDGVTNHWRLDCLPNRLFRHRGNNTSKLRVTWKMFPFDDVIIKMMNIWTYGHGSWNSMVTTGIINEFIPPTNVQLWLVRNTSI